MVEKICYGKKKSFLFEFERMYLDEAAQKQVHSSLSTNDIIEDTQSTHEEINVGISRRDTGIVQTMKSNKLEKLVI